MNGPIQRLAIVTPAFNEATNLEPLHGRLVSALDALGLDWRWVIVDDHSADDTFGVVAQLASRDPRVGGVRLSRNTGSHAAIACGLHHVDADAAVVLASDLQDPPEVLASLVEAWRQGSQVVWAVRRARPGEKAATLAFARLYYWLMRDVVGLRELPAGGSDFFLLDRRVVTAFRGYRERHTSVLALFAWMGFRQAIVHYDKAPRHSGKSGWTLRKRLKLVVDSVSAFSGAPLAVAGWTGGVVVVLAVVAAVAAAAGAAVSLGWLLAAVLAVGGLILLALAALGAYLWRALDEARARPAWMVEASCNVPAQVIPGVPEETA